MNKHKSNKIKENSNIVRHLIMGQITTTQNLVAIKEVRHAGQWHMSPYWLASQFCDRLIQVEVGIASVAMDCGFMWAAGISTVFRGHWQSFCTAVTAGKCLPLGLCKETVKESTFLYIYGKPNLVIKVFPDVLAPNNAMPSADTVLTTKLYMFSLTFLWLSVISHFDD